MASASAQLSVDRPRSLVTERIGIRASGLADTRVTLQLRISEAYGSFSSFGHFLADCDGVVDLRGSASYGGTYTGVDAMGLFWSLRQESTERVGLRLLRRQAAVPLRFRIRAVRGHVTWEELVSGEGDSSELCAAELERSYLSEEVEQVSVRFGRVRGSLFRPRGVGRHPAVIDVFGTGGGLMEHRAALLAKEGFCVLALAYFNFDDLPKQLKSTDLEYFEEALDFMQNCQYADGGGVGLVGTSYGADIVTQMSIQFGDRVAAVVWINGLHCHGGYPFVYRGRTFPNFFPIDESKVTISRQPPGLDIRGAGCSGCTEDQELPVEQARCDFLFISCLDDCSNPPESGHRLANRLRRSGKSNFEHVTYPGAGHLLEPPVSACTPVCYHGMFGVHIYYGGEPLLHHMAQVDSWDRIVRFLRERLAASSRSRL